MHYSTLPDDSGEHLARVYVEHGETHHGAGAAHQG